MTFDVNAFSADQIPAFAPVPPIKSSRFAPSAEKTSGVRLCEELEGDFIAREDLLDEAFGAARFKKTCVRLRDGRLPAKGLALAAKTADDELVGTLRLWHVKAGQAEAPLLGPLAVARSHRCLGLGRKLIAEALFRAVCFGHRAILLVGDSSYYSAFGFDRKFTKNLNLPGPVNLERFLGLELHEGALAGAGGLVTASGTLDLREYRRGNRSLRAA